MRANTLTLVVPCYNEADSLKAFCQEIQQLAGQLSDIHLDLLFVDDGSQDRTLSLIKTLCRQLPDRVQYISFSRNFGKEAAILAGLQHAQGEWVAVIDADLQDPPGLLVDMLAMVRDQGYDVVATRRVDRQGEPVLRSFFARLYYKLNNRISDVQIQEGARDFRLMTRQVVDAVLALPEVNRFSKGLFAWVGFDVAYLEYPNIQRSEGRSSWSFSRLFTYAVEGLISFSTLPLHIASVTGLLAFVLALIYGIYIVVRTLISGTVTPGWPSLAVLIVGMGGLQLLCLGIIGQYIAKIFLETKGRPSYIIKEARLNSD